MALDDATEENGAMDMFSFTALPESRGNNLGKTGDADFFIKVGCSWSFSPD